MEQDVWGSSPLSTHADVWGEDATLNLVDDTLRLRAENKYLPLGQVTTGRIQPEPSPSSKLHALLTKELCVDFIRITSNGEKGLVDQVSLAALSRPCPTLN
ncbi:hypothetical protein RvY_15269 [Ramazzottius varieornatus]|uniref:Uncharacterized protein n=1 Tax=Ramazzottius varieornatus TaxID=947166 RepID=A0A1D1W2D8_RAMVA|nr:hypothetical protein RvY_15269 [Ramazzottius varieornatus]